MNEKAQIEEWARIAERLSASNERQFLCEMARVGYFFGEKYEVYVHTNDPGQEPHFHIRDTGTQGQNFHTCVKIKEAMYFRHSGKMDFMNARMRRELVGFLQSPPPKKKNVSFPTNWDKVIYEWNENNSTMLVDEDQAMPDYIHTAGNLSPHP